MKKYFAIAVTAVLIAGSAGAVNITNRSGIYVPIYIYSNASLKSKQLKKVSSGAVLTLKTVASNKVIWYKITNGEWLFRLPETNGTPAAFRISNTSLTSVCGAQAGAPTGCGSTNITTKVAAWSYDRPSTSGTNHRVTRYTNGISFIARTNLVLWYRVTNSAKVGWVNGAFVRQPRP